MGLRLCDPCGSRSLKWHGFPLTRLAEQVVRLTHMLNCLPGSRFPDCVIHPDGSAMTLVGRHALRCGQGNDRETDVGVKAGSALMLAVLLPHVYGVPSSGPLRVCGWPPLECLTHISSRTHSGSGSDKRRMNVWEALLHHWQHDTEMECVRDLLAHTLLMFREGVHVLFLGHEVVWKLPRRVLQHAVPLAIPYKQCGLHGHMV